MRPSNGQTTLANTRRVWAALTADPRCNKLHLAAEIGIGPNTIHAAIRRLLRAGYINRSEDKNSYVVIIPLIIIGKEGQ